MRVLKKGMVGDDVKNLQEFLGIAVDGCFGAQTEAALKKWQKQNGLVADGIAGEKTWNKISKIMNIFGNNDNLDIIYDPLRVHITKSLNRSIKYIVIHYTAGASSKPGFAQNNKKIFESRNASADFAVDDLNIIQFNPDLKNYYTWAVGDNKNPYSTNGGKLNGIACNKNSISIEICSTLEVGMSGKYANHKGWSFSEKVLYNTKKLVRMLMKEYNIPISNVIRHYDVTGKLCPGIVGWNDESIYDTFGKVTKEKSTSEKWINFKNSI